jgi:hypothetical protein
MPRFSDIARAEKLVKAKAAYDNWLKLEAPRAQLTKRL